MLFTKNCEGNIPPPIKSNNCSFFSRLDKLVSKVAAVIFFFIKNFSYSILENLFSLLKSVWCLTNLPRESSDNLILKCFTSCSTNFSPIKAERNSSTWFESIFLFGSANFCIKFTNL